MKSRTRPQSRWTVHDCVDRGNLALAVDKACRSKPLSDEGRKFLLSLDDSLNHLAGAVLRLQVPIRAAKTFVVYDPKRRLITAPSFADRVLHHALFNLVGDRFEAALLPSVFACRKGRGLHSALLSLQQGVQRHAWFFQVDIQGYFPSIPHERLLAMVRSKIPERDLFEVVACIVRAGDSHGGEGCGLPIGALTSQYFANGYLSGADAWLAREADGFVRYMDDIVGFASTHQRAEAVARGYQTFLAEKLGLRIKPKVRISRTGEGSRFCGYRVKPGVILLGARKMRRARCYANDLQAAASGGADAAQLQRGYDQWRASLLPAQFDRFGRALWTNSAVMYA